MWDNNFGRGKGAYLKLFRKLEAFSRTDVVNTIIIREGSVYRDCFEDFYLKMWSHGFVKKFVGGASLIKFPVNLKDSGAISSFNIYDVLPIMKVLGLGLGCGSLIFIMEILVSFCS